MADKSQAAGTQGEYYPPPPGPPPGNNGLKMHPNERPIPEPQSELYDDVPLPPSSPPQQAQAGQTVHQPPPPDSDGAPKKAGWGQRLSMLGSKAAVPFNLLANKLGSETFLPSTMDKEVEKASRILRAFCSEFNQAPGPSPLFPSHTGTAADGTTHHTADGIYTDAQAPETVEAPTTDADGKPATAAAKPRKNRTLLTIPSKVIHNAAGLAVFTTARAGFHVSGATGSGVLVARLPDGSWSPPSGIQVHSVGAGFMIGIDIYDCVVVINTPDALEAFTKTRMSLGSDLAVVAGPWGAGGSVDFAAPGGGKGKATDKEKGKDAEREGLVPEETAAASPTGDEKTRAADPSAPAAADEAAAQETGEKAGEQPARPQAGKERKPSAFTKVIKQPTYSYVKSRGFYAGVQVDGTIVTERKDANAAFYGEPVSVQQILKGEAPLVAGKENWVNLVKPLFDTIKGAEGWHGQRRQSGGADPNSTYGTGNAPAGFPAGYDPVFGGGSTPPPPPPPPRSGSVAGATAGVAAMDLGGAQAGPSSAAGPRGETPAARAKAAKAAEAADEAAMNREREERGRGEMQGQTSGLPGYTEMTGSGAADGVGEEPPAYADEGVARPGVGDAKGSRHPA